jgi:meckelin
MRYAR